MPTDHVDRAMQGMLQAQENHLQFIDTPVINPSLRKLMERGRPEERLGHRLMIIQQVRDTPPRHDGRAL